MWHECFIFLLASLHEAATVGEKIKCGDGVTRWLWVIILILSADYEEQYVHSLVRILQALLTRVRCMMAGTRGPKSHFPCPVCLVPREMLKFTTVQHPMRTHSEAEKIVTTRNTRTAKEHEALLKAKGLRHVNVCSAYLLTSRLSLSLRFPIERVLDNEGLQHA